MDFIGLQVTGRDESFIQVVGTNRIAVYQSGKVAFHLFQIGYKCTLLIPGYETPGLKRRFHCTLYGIAVPDHPLCSFAGPRLYIFLRYSDHSLFKGTACKLEANGITSVPE